MKISKKDVGKHLVYFGLFLLFLVGYAKWSFDSKSSKICEAVNSSGGNMDICPAHDPVISYLFFAFFGASIAVITAGVFIHLSTGKNSPTSLSNEESRLVSFLRSKGGSAFQGEIRKQFGWSKVKTTRVLDSLELRKGVLERRRRGMSNIVVLKDGWFSE